MPEATLLSQPFAGLHSQILGLAEAARLSPTLLPIAVRAPWRWIAPRLWPHPLAAAGLGPVPPGLVLGIGGAGAAVGAALRRRGATVVQVQAPRLKLDRFDLVVVNRHDRIAGRNVITTRTALHRVTAERLAEARATWAPRLAHLPRPLVAVLVGGSNGRFRLERAEGAALAASLAALVRRDGAGLAITPSRRTAPAVRACLEQLRPLGAFVWDMAGENPYLGLLACADAILVTADSVSMVSEAAATAAPVLVIELPGRSRRIGAFLEGLVAEGRVRPFTGRLQTWDTAPLDDTPAAAAEMRHRLGL